MVGDSGSAQMRQESSPTVKMLRPMLGHGTQVRQRSIGEQTSGSLVDKEQEMNKRIKELEKQSVFYNEDEEIWETDLEKFAQLIVYDFLSELTNDDSLGEARIATIKRLAEKWGVAK